MFDSKKILFKSKGILKTRLLRRRVGKHAFYYLVSSLWFRLSLVLLGISFLIRSFLWQPVAVPSQSMLPTIFAGDYIFADKAVYGYNKFSMPFELDWFSGAMDEKKIRRGDIIIFRGKDHKNYIKRIIGFPGERLQMLNGRLYINGLPVKRERVTDFILPETINSRCFNAEETRIQVGKQTPICRYRQYKETLPGNISYMTLDLLQASRYDTSKLILVPSGSYYVMGDNRDQSLDSRVKPEDGGIGLVRLDRIMAKADIIVLSVDGTGDFLKFWHWPDIFRSERWLKMIDK